MRLGRRLDVDVPVISFTLLRSCIAALFLYSIWRVSVYNQPALSFVDGLREALIFSRKSFSRSSLAVSLDIRRCGTGTVVCDEGLST